MLGDCIAVNLLLVIHREQKISTSIRIKKYTTVPPMMIPIHSAFEITYSFQYENEANGGSKVDLMMIIPTYDEDIKADPPYAINC